MSFAPLRVAAAAYVLDAMSSEDLRRVSDEALTRGVYSYSLGELASANASVYSEVRSLFEAALQELAIPLPSPKDAAAHLVWHNLGRTYEGARTPLQAATALRRLSVELLNNPTVYPQLSAAEKKQLRDFEGCFWRYDEVKELSGPGGSINAVSAKAITTQVDQEMLETATRCMRDRFRGRINLSWVRWNDSAVVKMAGAIRDGRRFSDLPLLGDALDEAGCTDIELLEHCREQAPHVRDCWVVHLLLAAG